MPLERSRTTRAAQGSFAPAREITTSVKTFQALLRHIEGKPPFTILDFGCGPGRDLKTFTSLGHTAIGLDGATAFAAMARADTGCEVWVQDFLNLDLPPHHFDGVFANASLFHVPSQELPRVLQQLHASVHRHSFRWNEAHAGLLHQNKKAIRGGGCLAGFTVGGH